MDFNVGEKVFLKVSPMKAVIRFGKRGNLTRQFIGTFEIYEVWGLIVYRLALLSRSGVSLVFHISMHNWDGDYIIKWESALLDKDLDYKEEPKAILGQDVRMLRTEEISLVKVL